MGTDNFLYKELTERILNAVFSVHNTLGHGFLEKVYENALVYELHIRQIKYEEQQILKVYYRDIVVGDYVADIVVEDKVILEIKAVKELDIIFTRKKTKNLC